MIYHFMLNISKLLLYFAYAMPRIFYFYFSTKGKFGLKPHNHNFFHEVKRAMQVSSCYTMGLL